MVLDATTGALSDMNTRKRVLKLVRQANLELSAMKKSFSYRTTNYLLVFNQLKGPSGIGSYNGQHAR